MSAEVAEVAVRRAQVYQFLAAALLYPEESWTEDLPLLAEIGRELGVPIPDSLSWNDSLDALQSEHLRVFGLTGSLCYETEYGLPHEFQQSQELADVAGFYHAFGLAVGGKVRERPDHLAVELEFMSVLALKEACALQSGTAEQVEICIEAQRTFLRDHLGRWIELFTEALCRTAGESVYVALARFTHDFVQADVRRLGIQLERPALDAVRPTPFNPDFSCEGCALAEKVGGQEEPT
jgi:DMSO reductase family type II enzyme chaperone